MKCRITLDEVIAHERETAKEQKSKYDECIDDNMRFQKYSMYDLIMNFNKKYNV